MKNFIHNTVSKLVTHCKNVVKFLETTMNSPNRFISVIFFFISVVLIISFASVLYWLVGLIFTHTVLLYWNNPFLAIPTVIILMGILYVYNKFIRHESSNNNEENDGYEFNFKSKLKIGSKNKLVDKFKNINEEPL